MAALFRLSKMNHSIAFQIPRPSNHEIVIKVEINSSFSYEVNDLNEADPYSQTFVPVLVPVGRKPPYCAYSTMHDFYLRGARVVMVQENAKINYTTFTELVEMSERLHRENFPSAPSRSSSSSDSQFEGTTISEARTEPDEKPEIDAAASASVERQMPTVPAARTSDGAPTSKRFRSF